ncbi:hypothetical protein Trydic_g554 [Trypoxylus dichotomus]
MSQNTKVKGKKSSKDSNLESSNIGDKLNKKFRLSFRGNKSKKEKNKMTKGDDDEECATDNILNDYNKDNLEDYAYLCNNNTNSNFDPKIDCQREFICDNEIVRRNEQNIADSRAGNDAETIREESDETLDIITEILDEIFSAVVIDDKNSENSDSVNEKDIMCKETVGRRRPSDPDEKKLKSAHRKTCIADDGMLNPNLKMRELARRDSLYSVEEFDEELDENENHNKLVVQAINQVLVNQVGTNNFVNQHPKVKKKSSFLGSLFGRGKKEKKSESSKSKGLQSSRKYNSTFELSQRLLEKSPSFIRKSVKHVINKDVPGLLKRSFSVRDVEKKKEKHMSRDKLTEMKNLEWARSLQSLVENDNSVSYDDMSFINYDTLNTVTYNKPRPALNLQRTQSLIVHGSPGRNFSRGSSVPHHYQSAIDISEQSEALSLPSLQYAIRENEESVYDSSPTTRYRRRPQSVSSEDGKVRPRTNGSFRSAGSGCAKLKRTNACRQKSRDSLPLFTEQRNSQTQKLAYTALSLQRRSLDATGIVASFGHWT